jgi:hypothetical protein
MLGLMYSSTARSRWQAVVQFEDRVLDSSSIEMPIIRDTARDAELYVSLPQWQGIYNSRTEP